MTMGRGQNLSGAGAGNFKNGRLRQPCIIVLFFSLISVEGNKYAFGGVRMFLWVIFICCVSCYSFYTGRYVAILHSNTGLGFHQETNNFYI